MLPSEYSSKETRRKEARHSHRKWVSALADAGILGVGLGLGADILIKSDSSTTREENVQKIMRETIHDTQQQEMTQEDEDLLNLMEIRHSVYTFLSRMFGWELAVSDIKTLSKRARALQILPEVLEANDDKLVQALKLLLKTTESFDEREEEKVALELAAEYAGLFLGVRQKPAHPSESVYRSSTHLLMQKERDEVLFAYEKAGFEKDGSFFKEPEDHIALELAFMAELSKESRDRLSDKDREGLKQSLAQQKEFLQKHLSLWVEDLAKDIEKGARIDFYVAIGEITARFVELDGALLSDITESLSAQDGR